MLQGTFRFLPLGGAASLLLLCLPAERWYLRARYKIRIPIPQSAVRERESAHPRFPFREEIDFMPAKATSSEGFYGWINLATTATVGIMGGFYLVGFSFFMPFLIKDFGWNRGTASLAATINLIAMGI